MKDLIAVRGHQTTAGTHALQAPRSSQDAPVLAALVAAGAVLVGTTNLHALAFGPFSTSSDFGPAVNPRSPGSVAGGSSGGSAAAVASGAVDLALGTDTAGSIRIPASACGVVGLMATFGAVTTCGVLPLAPTLDHVGPIARTVREVAAAWFAMTGAPLATTSPSGSLRELRIGVPTTYVHEHLDTEVAAVLADALLEAGRRGAVVEEVEVEELDLAPAIMHCTIGPEALDVHGDLLCERGADLPTDVRLRLEAAMFVSAGDYVRAQRLRRRLTASVSAAVCAVEVLVLPTLPVVPPALDALEAVAGDGRWPVRSAMSRFTAPFNLTGHPALSIPRGTDSHGAGIGLQVVGAHHDEATVLEVGAALERP